jgi:HSP20 family protein
MENQMKGAIQMYNLVFSPITARLFRANGSYAWPDVDISESADGYTFSFEIPGALRDDIKIWLDGDILTVSGEKKKALGDNARSLFSEREFGKFERAFRLPESVDRSNVKAEFVDGVLVVSLPKAPETKAREITINS